MDTRLKEISRRYISIRRADAKYAEERVSALKRYALRDKKIPGGGRETVENS